MDNYVLANPVSLLPILAIIVLIVLGFLYFNSDNTKRNSLVLAAVLIVAWLFVLNWLF